MIMGNFLRNRKSIRDFKEEKVKFEKLEEIRQDLKMLQNEEGKDNFAFRIFENGDRLIEELSGKAGYAGVMIDAPHYIALDFLNDYDSTLIYGAYNMEKMITNLNEKGLATCWISVSDLDKGLKKEVFGDSSNNIDYILAFGYQKPSPPFSEAPFSVKLGIEDFVFSDETEKEVDTDKLQTMGLMDLFYYIRFAPSNKNLQPWRFILKDTNIELLLAYEKWDRHLLVDAGVIMYYFEELAKSLGIKNKWHLIDGNIYEGKNYNYKSIGVYQL
ncbi:MAG: nitroreductase family protein [Tissierellaceae bacterium]|nr:nitroreductase family protein [Tissierellaceae bacterium]